MLGRLQILHLRRAGLRNLEGLSERDRTECEGGGVAELSGEGTGEGLPL